MFDQTDLIILKYLCPIIVASFFYFNLPAQTCCSSGIPIASNIGFQSQGKNILQFSLAYENNRLAKLYNGTDVLGGSNRLRETHSGLVRFAYNIHERLILETLIPYISQRRIITQNNLDVNTDGGHGLGDLTLLSQFVLVKNQFSSFSIGGGLKFATGSTDLRNSMGLLLINDLQLGTGAIDFLTRMSIIRSLSLKPSVSLFLNATSIFRGSDREYLGNQAYKFGDEIQVNLGYADQVLFLKTFIYPSLSIRFRGALQDEINSNLLDNTGGTWLFARGGVGIDVLEGHRLSLAFEYPLYTKVVGTQLSPSYILNFSYYRAIDFSPSDFN